MKGIVKRWKVQIFTNHFIQFFLPSSIVHISITFIRYKGWIWIDGEWMRLRTFFIPFMMATRMERGFNKSIRNPRNSIHNWKNACWDEIYLSEDTSVGLSTQSACNSKQSSLFLTYSHQRWWRGQERQHLDTILIMNVSQTSRPLHTHSMAIVENWCYSVSEIEYSGLVLIEWKWNQTKYKLLIVRGG